MRGTTLRSPLALVREIIPIHAEDVQAISGKAAMVIRDEILPVFALASLIGWPRTQAPAYGVLMQSAVRSFILAVDSFVGRDDVVIKPLEDIKPRGVAGATQSGDGSVVLVLDVEELLREVESESRGNLLKEAAERDNLFIAGMLSLLGTILRVPMDEITSQIPMPEAIGDALASRQGPYGPFL